MYIIWISSYNNNVLKLRANCISSNLSGINNNIYLLLLLKYIKQHNAAFFIEIYFLMC